MKLLFAFVAILLMSVATGQVVDPSYVCDPGNLPPVDVMFILSSNHTMSNFEFQEKLQIVEEYVSKVNIGNNSVRVGVISEYEYSDVEFHLDDHMTKSELLRALPYIYYGQEGALAGEAFKYMSEEDLNVHLGGRPGVPDVVIFLTNSNTAGNDFAKNNSEKVQVMGATVIGLGVGDFHKLDLVNVASGCHYVDQSPNFTHSHTHLVGAALNLTCDALAGVPANECCELPTCCPNDVDVLFLLDASSLQSKDNFEKQLFYADNMTQALHVSGNNSRVAAMTYSTHPHPQFTFDQHLNKTDLLQAIEFLPYQFGERHVEEGLKYVLAHDFLNNSRPGVQKVVFVTTTGPQQGENDKIPGYIAEMVNQGARVVSVGMGNTVIDTEVTIMATGANGNALVYNDFDAFLAGWKDGIRLVCEGGAKSASTSANITPSQVTPPTPSQASVSPSVPALSPSSSTATPVMSSVSAISSSMSTPVMSSVSSISPSMSTATPVMPSASSLPPQPSINPSQVPVSSSVSPQASVVPTLAAPVTAPVNTSSVPATTVHVPNFCDFKPCQNGGTCVHIFNTTINHTQHVCQCTPAWDGPICTDAAAAPTQASVITPAPTSSSTSATTNGTLAPPAKTLAPVITTGTTSSNASAPTSPSVCLDSSSSACAQLSHECHTSNVQQLCPVTCNACPTVAPVDWCHPNPCQNNAITCVDAPDSITGHNRHLCVCSPGWVGEFCTEKLTTPAATTTTPIPTTTSTTTTTPMPTTTTTTKTTKRPSLCDVANPCQNGGTCTASYDVIKNYDTLTCLCSSGWHGEICSDACTPKPTDLIFLLDASTSEGQDNFNKEVEFVGNVVKSLEVGPDKIQIALAEFSTGVNPQIQLNDFHNNVDEALAIGNTTYLPGFTMTALALKYAREEMLDPSNGRRLDAQAVVVVLTDGKSTIPADTVTQAQMLKDTGALVVAVGIGKDVDQTELAAIASGPEHTSTVTSFDLLNTIQQDIVVTTTTCDDGTLVPVIPTQIVTALVGK